MEWRHTVWPEARLVYTAIPKVANTSIKAALLEAYRLGEASQMVSETAIHKDGAPYLSTKPELITARYPDYLHFTFVRDPFERLVSFWAQKIETGTGVSPRLQRLGFRPRMPFAQSAALVCEVPDEEADPHFRSQSYLLLHGGRLLPNFVGRFETMERDWEVLRRLANARSVRSLGSLPRRTVSEHGSAQEYYDDDLAQRVVRRFAADFEVLGYETRTRSVTG